MVHQRSDPNETAPPSWASARPNVGIAAPGRKGRWHEASASPLTGPDAPCYRERDLIRPAMQLISIPSNPVPQGAVTGMVKTPDGAALRFARWLPPAGRKGTLCVFHGRAEFIEKYFEVVRDAQERGFAVASVDWRGQGLSQRFLGDERKGHVRDFSQYDVDLDTFIKEIVCAFAKLSKISNTVGAIITSVVETKQQLRDQFNGVIEMKPRYH